uniref:Uncharacterized protein n=1 Tax=Entomoneis paludosa TaxID=265537 RepID=A0A7S2YKK8_9STRA
MSTEIASGDGSKTTAAARIDQQAGEIEKGKQGSKLTDLEKADMQDGEDEEEDGFCSGRTLKTRIVHGVAISSVVLNIAAMAVSGAAGAVIVAALFAVVIAPVVIFFQLKLQDTDTMRELQNLLRKDVNKLQDENNKLEAEVNVLEETVGELKEQEKRLAEITAEQGSNVDEFVALVKENRELIEKEKSVVRHETAQIVATVVINSDHDYSGKLDEKETSRLKARLRHLPGVKVNERALIRSLNETDGSRAQLLKLINNIVNDDKDKYTSAVFDLESQGGDSDDDSEKKEEDS